MVTGYVQRTPTESRDNQHGCVAEHYTFQGTRRCTVRGKQNKQNFVLGIERKARGVTYLKSVTIITVLIRLFGRKNVRSLERNINYLIFSCFVQETDLK